MFDITKYFRPGDPFLAINKLEDVLAGYTLKHAIATELKPKSIVEIGVRAGYSAAAFLAACPMATFLGLDADNGRDGGEVGYSLWTQEMLEDRFPQAKVAVLRCDTQQEDWVSSLATRDSQLATSFDLAHVDGDHSYAGCLKDLAQSARVAKAILVDDVDFIPDVERAVCRFLFDLHAAGRPPRRVQYWPSSSGSLRGDVLIELR